MKVNYGVYLETNFKYKSGELSCQDIYSKLLDLLSIRKNICFNFLIKTSKDIAVYNKVERFNKIYFLKPYRNLISLVPFYIFYIPFSIKQITKFVDDSDCLIIMIPSPISKTIFEIAKQKNKKIILLVRQDIIEMVQNRYSGLKKLFAIFFANYYQNYFLNNIDNKVIILTSGEKLRLSYLKHSSLVYNFADSRYFNKDVINFSEIKEIDLNKKLKILFVGRLEINKGIRELLNAALVFKNQILLTIVGSGHMRNEIDNFIKVNYLNNSIKCLGFIEYGEELLKIYRLNDFFLFPSYSEGLPQVLLEAMSNGCLVLTTDVGSIPYIIKNNLNGILFKANNQISLNNTIQMLINGGYDITTLRENAIKTSLEYTFEKQIGIFESCLDN